METTYFLFGKEASEMLMEEGMDSFINSLEQGEFDFELYEFNSDTKPAELPYTFERWGAFSVLSFEEYNRISQL